MSSYNNIRKIKYTKNPTDVVSLQEYIIFEDSHAKEKFVVFRFSNNVNQRLFEIRFEVLQYNADNELLEKSVVVHKDFVAEANDLFVPNAKLKINFECESLEVRLEAASFDRVNWSDGEFTDNSYRFDSYAETVTKTGEQAQPVQKKKNDAQPKTNVKKNKLGFNIRNITRRNKAVFPAVFNIILCVLLIGLVIGSTFYFKSVTGAYKSGDFVVKQSDGYVTILQYGGDSEEVEIPAMLDNFYVSKIADGAFMRSGVKTVNITTTKSLYIEAGAFESCASLSAVTASEFCGRITVMEGAFQDCKSLETFAMPTAELSKGCFDGTSAIKTLIFYRPVYNEGKLLDLFAGGKPSLLFYYFNTAVYSAPDGFYDGL